MSSSRRTGRRSDSASHRDGLVEWGRSPYLSAFETLTWRVEADPRLRSTITLVEILDREPDWERLLAAHEWATRVVPRFRQRVVEPILPVGRAAWVVDRNFDLNYHVRHIRLPDPGTVRQLLDLAQQQAMTPFDRARSPWEATLVSGLEGGGAAYILKLHHATTDGLGGIQLLSMLHGRERAAAPKPQPDAPDPGSVTPTRLLVDNLGQRIRGAPSLAIRPWTAGFRFARTALGGPIEAVGDVARLASSAHRVLGPPPADRSPLLAGASLSWHFETHEVALTDLKAAARTVGGSVNDAFIAALLGAFRLYHEHFGVDIDRIPIAIPISLRTTDDPMGGNKFAGARFAAPIGEVDPGERIRAVRQFILDARGEPAIDALNVVTPLLGLIPTPLMTKLIADQADGHDIQASNVPGIGHAAYLADAEVTHMFPFGPVPGCAAMVAMVSHNGRCCIGVNLDPAAITDPELFARCLKQGFDEVLELAEGVTS